MRDGKGVDSKGKGMGETTERGKNKANYDQVILYKQRI